MRRFDVGALPGRLRSAILLLLLLGTSAGSVLCQKVNITTFHGDAARLGWNAHETALKPATVNARNFGKVWETPLDGQIYGSPLYISGLTIQGKKRDVVFTATENNSVYALDAANGQLIWGPNRLAPALNEAQYNDCNNIHPLHGITSTPCIDLETKTLYVCGITQPGIRQIYEVWGIDILSGEVRSGWPVTIKGSYKGLAFDGGQVTQRGALNLVNGWLYLPFGSRCDIGEWHGWVMGVNTRDPSAPQRAFTPAPTTYGGGIWGSGGVAADSEGNLFCVTGNGDYDLDRGGSNVCESVLRLRPDGSELKLSPDAGGYYVPSNYKELDESDVDMGGSGCVLMPEQQSAGTPKMLVTCGKDGLVYLLNRDQPGGLGGELQKKRLFGKDTPGFHSNIKTTPAYFDAGDAGHFVYIAGNETGPEGEAGVVAMKLSTDRSAGNRAKLDIAWTLKAALKAPGTPTVSSNGHKDGIVWEIESNKDDGDLGPPGVLYAFDAVSGRLLYSSNQDPTRDTLEDARKFSCPTVANGRVFIGTHGIVAYGQLHH